MSPADQSVRKQLPYVPKYSPSLTGYISWGTWAFLYKWAFYSECFTMSSNDYTLIGDLPRYFMSNILFEKKLLLKPMDVQLKFAVNNLLNEDYSRYYPAQCQASILSCSSVSPQNLGKIKK